MVDSEWEDYAENNKTRLEGRGVLGKRDPLYKKTHASKTLKRRKK